MAAWSATVSFAGGVQRRADLIASGERGIYAAFVMLTLASLGLWTAILTHDFSFEHVASFTSANLPLVYTLSAFWGGPVGSLLLWALILAGWSAVAVYTSRDRDRALLPYVPGTLALILALPVAALCLGMNPYGRIDWAPLDGRGMSPLLQQPGMTLHPPVLYLGLACTAVPFAFAIAALIARRVDGDWMPATRRWVVTSWLFLTLGIVLGMWWAYTDAGRDGSWVRDPVENGAIFPWLVNTVLLHSLGAGEKRGVLRKWNVGLLLLAFLLAIYSAFVAGGGIISNANSYAQSPAASWATGFLVLAVAACGYLLMTRRRELRRASAVSDEAGTDARHAPAMRSARRFAMAIVYAGIVLVLVALMGQTFATARELTLTPGQSRELRDPFGRAWRFTSQGVSQYNELNRSVLAAAVDVSRGGRSLGIITTEQRQYMNSRGIPTAEPWTEAGTLGTLAQDVRVVLAGAGEDERVAVRIGFNPLMIWVWIGGGLMAIGGSMLLIGSARKGA